MLLNLPYSILLKSLLYRKTHQRCRHVNAAFKFQKDAMDAVKTVNQLE
jgi:hypothetical protein